VLRAIPVEPTLALALVTGAVVIAFFVIVGIRLLRREVSTSDPNDLLR